MKKYGFGAVVLCFGFILAACSAKEDKGSSESIWRGLEPGADLESYTERAEFYDFVVEEESFDAGLWEKNDQEQSLWMTTVRGGTGYSLLGTQFWKGEPIQLWVEVSPEGRDIYLYRPDGSNELLLEDVAEWYTTSSTNYEWYRDQEGDFYCYGTVSSSTGGSEKQQGSLVKILSNGEVLYESRMEEGYWVDDFCQAEDGRIFLQLQETGPGIEAKRVLVEIEPDTGEVVADSRMELPFSYLVYLGNAEGLPAVTGYTGEEHSYKIVKVEEGGGLTPAMYFTGTTYSWHEGMKLQDFQMQKDGQIAFLWTDYDGHNGMVERLRMEKIEKVPVVLRGCFYTDTWITELACKFNRENDTYHVVIEDCGDGNDMEDFARITSIQVGAGKGPDILCGFFLEDYVGGMVDKGVLEELDPYLEASGIRKEDYFPLAFSAWSQGGKCYAVNPVASTGASLIKEEVLGSRETPDIEALADALLAWEGDGLYRRGYSAAAVLRSFLIGTGDLWGMVNWETGSCDFDTALFHKLLEAARRYGDDGRKELQDPITSEHHLWNFVSFQGTAEQKAKGLVKCGTLFDDGCYAYASSFYAMALNSNSAHKEGAWEFIRYLIGDEVQKGVTDWNTMPVHREAFDSWVEMSIQELVEEHYVNGVLLYPAYYGVDASEEKQEEFRKTIESARYLPLRTEPVLAVIQEEAADYFDGSKNAEEVSRVITNRVQLYLDENR